MNARPLALALLLFASPAQAAPPPNPDPALHAWFEGQYSIQGDWCCNVSDGHVLTDAEWRLVGAHYEVRIAGRWVAVHDGALRNPAGGPNPMGAAVVWYVANSVGVTIFCFAPGELF